jgi:hypothetical protein
MHVHDNTSLYSDGTSNHSVNNNQIINGDQYNNHMSNKIFKRNITLTVSGSSQRCS